MLYSYKEMQNYLKKLGLNPTSAGNLQRALRRNYQEPTASIYSKWYGIGVENPIDFPVSEECIISHIKDINEGNYRRYNLGKKGLEEVKQIQKALDIVLDSPLETSPNSVPVDVDERNLFIAIRSLCWFNLGNKIPEDEEILDCIRDAKERYDKL